MAKITQRQVPGNTGAPATPPQVPLRPAGHVTGLAPQPFAVITSKDAKAAKNPRRAAENATKTPRLKGADWFRENFSGLATDIVQIRSYPDRKNGFHCPPCGIAGSNAIVIRGKDGKGEPLDIMGIDPSTKQQYVVGTIRGFMVGGTCLKKYGGLDINKVQLQDPSAHFKVPEPQLKADEQAQATDEAATTTTDSVTEPATEEQPAQEPV